MVAALHGYGITPRALKSEVVQSDVAGVADNK